MGMRIGKCNAKIECMEAKNENSIQKIKDLEAQNENSVKKIQDLEAQNKQLLDQNKQYQDSQAASIKNLQVCVLLSFSGRIFSYVF